MIVALISSHQPFILAVLLFESAVNHCLESHLGRETFIHFPQAACGKFFQDTYTSITSGVACVALPSRFLGSPIETAPPLPVPGIFR